MANLNINSNLGDAICGYFTNKVRAPFIPDQLELHEEQRRDIVNAGGMYGLLLYYSDPKDVEEFRCIIGRCISTMINKGDIKIKKEDK